VIVGGGVAGLEATLALRDLAGQAVAITLLTPDAEFVYRPMTVREPFGFSRAKRYSLEDIAHDLGVDLVRGSFRGLDAQQQLVHTEAARSISYDALLLSLGARLRRSFPHAITIDDRELDEQLHGLIQDLEAGTVHRLAFLAPSPMPWPLPIYELALMTARRAYDMNISVSITVVTPEEAPLAVFGTNVSRGVEELLTEHGIVAVPSAHAEVPEPGHVTIKPGERSLDVDRIVALPQLLGPVLDGVPGVTPEGFVHVDEYSSVRGLDRVWAAGDATDFPVKLGGIAEHQADVAASEIARSAGLPAERRRFHPEIHAVLLGGREPLYLSAHITGGHGMSSELSTRPSGSRHAKISSEYLSTYLETRDRVASSAR
jgi:sulfide:quinone oxidoreductase